MPLGLSKNCIEKWRIEELDQLILSINNSTSSLIGVIEITCATINVNLEPFLSKLKEIVVIY